MKRDVELSILRELPRQLLSVVERHQHANVPTPALLDRHPTSALAYQLPCGGPRRRTALPHGRLQPFPREEAKICRFPKNGLSFRGRP